MQEAKTVRQCQCCRCTGIEKHPDQVRHHQINLLVSRLNEQERRWFVGLESKRIGHGGDTLMCQVTGLHVETIRRGRHELDSDLQERPVDRIRLPGGGRPTVKKKDVQIEGDLKALVENDWGGDPEGGFRFVRPTLRSLSEQLAGRASHVTVSRLLYGMGISPRINIKRFTGPDHPDRDVQFRYILEMRELFVEAGWPAVNTHRCGSG